MNIKVKQAFESETEALDAMIKSMSDAIGQMKSFTNTVDVLVASCPSALLALAQVASNQLPKEKAEEHLLASIASDLGNDVEKGLLAVNANVKFDRRQVHQPVTLAPNVSWEDLINYSAVAIEYMKERVRLNNSI